MGKKLIMSCAAIAAFVAFAIAPAAVASPVLTSGGVAVAVGTSWEHKNTGSAIFGGGGEVICSTAVLKGAVTANTGSSIKGEIPVGSASFTGTGSSGACTSALGDARVTILSKFCFATSGSDTVTVTGCGANVTIVVHYPMIGAPCPYSTASMTGTFNTGIATINLNAQPLTREAGAPIFCPSTGKLTVDFDLYVTGGAQMTIS